MKLAAIYTRVSSNHQKDTQSIESQVANLLEYAQQEAYQVPPEWIFRDQGYSGSILKRPGLDKIRDLAAEQELEALLVYAPDRLSRNYAYQMILIEELNNEGVAVIFRNSPPSDSPESVLFLQFQGMIAQYERALITERTRRGKRHKAKLGLVSVLSAAPYGYHYIKKTEQTHAYYQIFDSEASIVRDIYTFYTQNFWTIGKITQWLNEQKIPTRTGKSWWGRSAVWAILSNPAYKGKACFGKTKQVERKKMTKALRQKGGYSPYLGSHQKTPRTEWIEIDVPAIINSHSFELAQEQLDKNKRFAKGRTKVRTLLQGMMICKNCGYAFHRTSGQTSKGKIYYYRCTGSENHRFEEGRKCDNRPIRQDYLDQLVWNHLIDLLENPQLIELEINKRAQQAQEADPLNRRKEKLLNENKKLQKRIDKLLDAYQEDLLPLNELRKRMPLLRKRKATLEAELKSLQAKGLYAQNNPQASQNMEKFLRQLKVGANKMPIEDKQKVLRLLVKDIIVDDDSIRINHCIKIKGETEGGKENNYLSRRGSHTCKMG